MMPRLRNKSSLNIARFLTRDYTIENLVCIDRDYTFETLLRKSFPHNDSIDSYWYRLVNIENDGWLKLIPILIHVRSQTKDYEQRIKLLSDIFQTASICNDIDGIPYCKFDVLAYAEHLYPCQIYFARYNSWRMNKY